MSKVALLSELGRHFKSGETRHQRAGGVLAEWIMERVADDYPTSLRVKTGPFGLLDTPYAEEAYAVAGEVLRGSGIEVEAHRYSKKRAVPFIGGIFDVIYVLESGEMVDAQRLPSDRIPNKHIKQLYPPGDVTGYE